MKKSIIALIAVSVVVVLSIIGYLIYATITPAQAIRSYKTNTADKLNSTLKDVEDTQAKSDKLEKALEDFETQPETAKQALQIYQLSLDGLNNDYADIYNNSKLKSYPLAISKNYKNAQLTANEVSKTAQVIQANIKDEKDLSAKSGQLMDIYQKYSADLKSDDQDTAVKAFLGFFKDYTSVYRDILALPDFAANPKVTAAVNAMDKFTDTYAKFDAGDTSLAEQLIDDADAADVAVNAADDEIQVVSTNSLNKIKEDHKIMANKINAL